MSKTPSLKAIDTARYVPSLLSVLNNRLSSSASDLYLQNFDVGLNEWRIMVVSPADRTSRPRRSRRKAPFTKPSSAATIKEMEKKGYISFEKGKWERLIALTSEGEAIYERVLKVALRREQLLLDGFKPHERDLLCEFLLRMTSNAALVESLKPGDVESGTS